MFERRAMGGSIVLRPDRTPNGVKIFSATMYADRDRLGEKVTEWMSSNAKRYTVTEIVVTQSSDASFHMVALTVFYWEDTSATVGTVTRA